MPPKLGVLAGGGSLPRQIVDACLEQGREVVVVAFEGATDTETVSNVDHCWTRLGAVGRTIDWLREHRAEELVLAGRMARPSWGTVRPDWRGLKMLPKILSGGQGDDAVLSVAIRELETEGFRVVGVHDVLPGVLADAGPMGKVRPDADALADIERGVQVANALGAVDVGQAVVVQQGVVLGVEAAEGTDALILRCADLKRDGRPGILVKCAKPEQEKRADLPSIGPDTVSAVVQAGLCGIAVSAGTSLILDRDRTLAQADQNGVFVFGVEATA